MGGDPPRSPLRTTSPMTTTRVAVPRRGTAALRNPISQRPAQRGAQPLQPADAQRRTVAQGARATGEGGACAEHEFEKPQKGRPGGTRKDSPDQPRGRPRRGIGTRRRARSRRRGPAGQRHRPPRNWQERPADNGPVEEPPNQGETRDAPRPPDPVSGKRGPRWTRRCCAAAAGACRRLSCGSAWSDRAGAAHAAGGPPHGWAHPLVSIRKADSRNGGGGHQPGRGLQPVPPRDEGSAPSCAPSAMPRAPPGRQPERCRGGRGSARTAGCAGAPAPLHVPPGRPSGPQNGPAR